MNRDKILFDQLGSLSTERRNRKSMSIDSMNTRNILRLINSEDAKVAKQVRKEIPHIAKAAELVVRAFKSGGRLIYVGAGTSGRLGILDASECPPTFGTPPRMVQGVIAGGNRAVFRSREGAEDSEKSGIMDMVKLRIDRHDVVCGIAASLRTPYVVAAVCKAKELGAGTIYITSNPRSAFARPEFKDLRKHVDIAICPDVGPEIIMGSTRMKSGTAQKMVLNMITTAAMIRMGKVYQNMMVDLTMKSQKLHERARKVVMVVAGVDYKTAGKYLKKADDHVKTAIVMIKTGISPIEARKLLIEGDGFIRSALKKDRKIQGDA